jgi:hypothetical protein
MNVSTDTRSEQQVDDSWERDRVAWNLPRPLKRPQRDQPLSSVQLGREDKPEADPEAA